jgi:hypothetical protein
LTLWTDTKYGHKYFDNQTLYMLKINTKAVIGIVVAMCVFGGINIPRTGAYTRRHAL